MSEKSEENTEKNAWRFVDLVFTGKYRTEPQVKNLKKLVKLLIKNYKMALPYIDSDIKSLIYDAFNGSDADLKKRLNTCYESLYFKRNEDDLPYYLIELKKLISADEKDTDKKDTDKKDADKKDTDIKDADKKDTDIKFTDEERELIKKLYEHVIFLFKKYYTYININNSTRQNDDLDLRIKNASRETENNIKRELYPEFITLLGIFTAITFAIFGGMNLLSNLFQNMKSTHASLGQALIFASIFGFTMLGIIEILFIWISKINLTIVDKDYRYDKKEDDTNEESFKEHKIYESKKKFEKIALTSLALTLLVGFVLFFF